MRIEEPRRAAGNRPLGRALSVLWVVLAVLTYVFDARPLNVWITAWAILIATTVTTLCSNVFRQMRRRRGERFARSRTRTSARGDGDINDETASTLTLRHQLKTIWSISAPYLRESRDGRWLLYGMFVIVLMNSGVSVLFSFASKNFYNSLNAGDPIAFQRAMMQYAGVLLLYAPIISIYSVQKELVSNHWRDWMTKRTLELYARNRVYYHLENNVEIDNPDQRIAEDVKSFTKYSLKLTVQVVKDAISLVSFAIILSTISPELFLVIIVYVSMGTVITLFLGRPLIALNITMLKSEADFRFSLVRFRENAESVAFYGGEVLEMNVIKQRLGVAIQNRIAILWRSLKLESFTNLYFYTTWILPVAIVAPRYFANEIELGSVTQAREAFYHVVKDISILISEFEQISKFSAGICRLGSFYDAMQDADSERNSKTPLLKIPPSFTKSVSESTVDTSDSLEQNQAVELKTEINILSLPTYQSNSKEILSVHHLTLITPGHSRVLIQDLDFSLNVGENLLIVGDSGSGKSSLLRCIAGLWKTGKGSVERPSDDNVYFLPQRPYCTVGSLKDQLLYPIINDVNASVTINVSEGPRQVNYRQHVLNDDELLRVLELVNLSKLAYQVGNGDPLKGLAAVEDWSNMLSLGEQQRLAFGRVIVNRPRLVILDEATSALDMATEALMYRLLNSMEQSDGTLSNGDTVLPFEPIKGLTYVSVGHRPSLLAFHDTKLCLREAGHKLSDIDKEVAAQITAASSLF